MKTYEEIYPIVKNTLSEYRLYHSECVAERCVELAEKYNYDINKARLVGLVHDIAKEMPNDEKIKYCERNYMEIDEIERENPGLLHGKIAADIAKKDFGFDEEMCLAVQYHTTGKEDMSKLEKIVYVADMSGKDRQFPDKEYIVELGNRDLEECVKYILKVSIRQRIAEDKKIHLNSIKALNYFMK